MPINKMIMVIAAFGALASTAMAVWNADPITEFVLWLVAAVMLALINAPYAGAFYIAWQDQGARGAQLLLLVAVVFAIGISIYANYAFAMATGKAKDPLMLAAAIIYQALAIGGAAFLNAAFSK
jgi:hypothetical protein